MFGKGTAVLISVMHLGANQPSVDQPSWEQIEAAVRQMDGHGRCEVIIMADEQAYLMLGGGADGLYVCEVVVRRGDFILCDPTKPDGDPVLINDGQPSLYEPRHVVSLGRALEATGHFATTRELDPTLAWYKY
jgi:hypothetical protein